MSFQKFLFFSHFEQLPRSSHITLYATTVLQMSGLVRPVQPYEMASLATDLYNFYFLRLLTLHYSLELHWFLPYVYFSIYLIPYTIQLTNAHCCWTLCHCHVLTFCHFIMIVKTSEFTLLSCDKKINVSFFMLHSDFVITAWINSKQQAVQLYTIMDINFSFLPPFFSGIINIHNEKNHWNRTCLTNH